MPASPPPLGCHSCSQRSQLIEGRFAVPVAGRLVLLLITPLVAAVVPALDREAL
jgi:hypothetical protein